MQELSERDTSKKHIRILDILYSVTERLKMHHLRVSQNEPPLVSIYNYFRLCILSRKIPFHVL